MKKENTHTEELKIIRKKNSNYSRLDSEYILIKVLIFSSVIIGMVGLWTENAYLLSPLGILVLSLIITIWIDKKNPEYFVKEIWVKKK